MHTEGLRKQHQEILAVLTELQAFLDSAERVARESQQIRKLLTQLYGKVQIHLSMEDNILYPKMIKGFDSELSQMALDLQAEMGEIKQTFSRYIQHWMADQIEVALEMFRQLSSPFSLIS